MQSARPIFQSLCVAWFSRLFTVSPPKFTTLGRRVRWHRGWKGGKESRWRTAALTFTEAGRGSRLRFALSLYPLGRSESARVERAAANRTTNPVRQIRATPQP